jgi:hypothetical protein
MDSVFDYLNMSLLSFGFSLKRKAGVALESKDTKTMPPLEKETKETKQEEQKKAKKSKRMQPDELDEYRIEQAVLSLQERPSPVPYVMLTLRADALMFPKTVRPIVLKIEETLLDTDCKITLLEAKDEDLFDQLSQILDPDGSVPRDGVFNRIAARPELTRDWCKCLIYAFALAHRLKGAIQTKPDDFKQMKRRLTEDIFTRI